MGKREPSYTVGGNISWGSHCGKQYRDFRKLKIELSYDPAIPLQGLYPGETIIQKDAIYPCIHNGTIHNSQDMETM